MFDEIFKRWITTGILTQDDIVPLFLEWNQTFGDGNGTAQEVLVLLNFIHTDYNRIMQKILRDIGIKRGYSWEEIIDKNGIIINRFFVNNK